MTAARSRRSCLSRAAAVAGCAAVVLTLAACETPPYEARTPQTMYPIEVERRTFAATVDPADIRASGVGALPQGFVSEYRRRGDGPILLMLPASGRGAAAGRRLARALQAEALDVEVVRNASSSSAVEVSFMGAVAFVPSCGSWADGTIHNPNRWPALNYGCAYQRNIGLMVANPQDLERAAPLGEAQATQPVGTVRAWRGRGQLGSPAPRGEAGGITAIGE